MRDGQQLGPRETPWQRPCPGQASLSDMLMYRLYQAWSQSNPVFVRLCEGRYGITGASGGCWPARWKAAS